jgi:hypothetical protein
MFGAFGESLATLQSSAFFRWFSLAPEASSDANTRTFRPSGAAFHDLVSFEALTGDAVTLRELRLILARSFIDDARNGAFALDITKSFLRDALGQTPLVHDLERRLALSVDIRRADAATPEPVALSDGEDAVLQTYAGLLPQCELRAGELMLRMENARGSLSIAISAV